MWWCPTARGLEDVSHGNRWDESGANIGGPAPSGLASWQVTVQSSRVFLGAPRPAPTRDGPVLGPPEQERELVPPCGRPGCLPHLRRLGDLGLAHRRSRSRSRRLDPPRGRVGRGSRRRAGSPLRARRMRRFGRRCERRHAAPRHGPTGRSSRGTPIHRPCARWDARRRHARHVPGERRSIRLRASTRLVRGLDARLFRARRRGTRIRERRRRAHGLLEQRHEWMGSSRSNTAPASAAAARASGSDGPARSPG